ncbi:hypothetical protein BDW59DRAFT_138658 [Aspergillus cavernicola]|uniref:Uncharacterized protein n=1 Tax=Aspergillus cavernicola TaxID=176166 RepID=A0ABR4J068_9EURO
MGRRAFLNRLALGRSPYEPPELPAGSPADQANSTAQRTSLIYADPYVQHYDERGHPVNPESKSFGRELRRAKNDILSTMGIVVSEDATRGRNEQQKIDAIVAENDYGLVMVTLDQISVFLGSWWTTSLTGRIQTFKSYAHVPLTRIIAHERASIGALGFYFAGIPAWAVSTCLSICRHHPLERLIAAIQNRFPNNDTTSKVVRASFTILHSTTRGALLILAMQTYMYSLLQSLHLIHPASFPSIGYFMPLGEFTSMLLPSSPPDFSVRSLGTFVLDVLKTPSLFYIYVYLRPVIEVRLYRLIRRRLPKPSLTDDLSIKVALDNDLIDWMVPTLGRRAVEETQRGNLSLLDDLLYEMGALRQWLSSKFSKSTASHASGQVTEPISDADPSQSQSVNLPPFLEQQSQSQTAQLDSIDHHPASIHGSDAHFDSGDSWNEETQLPNGDNMDILRRARNLTLSTRASSPDPEAHRDEAATTERRRQSRSDTLLSRSSSPTSSQSSPQVRAQLIDNSDVIAMQLALESRHTHVRRQGNAAVDEDDQQNTDEGPAGRRSISDLLDTLLSNQGQNLSTIINSEATDSDGLSNTTAVVSPEPGSLITISAHENQSRNTTEGQPPIDRAVEATASSPMNILPDAVEEPPLDDINNHPSELQPNPHTNSDSNDESESEIFPQLPDPTARHPPTTGTTVPSSTQTHRVTILSALPVDSLASHLSSMTTTALFAPLESFYLRSLASSYLASKGASATLRADVYHLGVWGSGGPSRTNALAYIGKMALMMGIQAAVNASVWGVISGSAIRIGRRWCGWGQL